MVYEKWMTQEPCPADAERTIVIYKKWMSQEAFASDGTWTIGYVNGTAAMWKGVMHVLLEGEYYTKCAEDTLFVVAFQGLFVVKNGRWIKKPKKASIIEHIKTMEAPESYGEKHCEDHCEFCYEEGYAVAIEAVVKYLEEKL